MFHYSLAEDREAATLLSKLIPKSIPPSTVRGKLWRKAVLVFGAGPSLEDDIRTMSENSSLEHFSTIAADGAALAFEKVANRGPDIIVTDLDGLRSRITRKIFTRTIVVVHGHGDNIMLLRKLVPCLGSVHGTTQAEPLPNVHNYGGFTDGDRAVFLADAYGAKMIVLAGMDFGKTVGSYSKPRIRDQSVKLRKLGIAQELLEYLAKHSGADLYNVTSRGVDIQGFRRIQSQDPLKLLKRERHL